MTTPIAEAERALDAEMARIVGRWPGIVCFANDWNGDPTSKHHIMRLYASATDVVWVESSGMRRPNLGSMMDLRRIAQRLSRAAESGRRRPDGRVRVTSPLAVPLPGNRIAERLNGWLYKRAVTRASMTASAPPLLWVYTPTVAPYLRHFPNSGIVYHCVDRWWAFSDYDERLMRRYHESLCRQADVVFASAFALLEDCRRYSGNAHLMPHGVEWSHFARAALEPMARPDDIHDITTPIIGFFGLIHEWVDQELLAHVAKTIPSATIVLIGKVQTDVGRLREHPNIRFVGQKPYAQLPAYASAFDVAIVPFLVNDLTLAVNPIKLREYRSAGLPVVSTALPEIRTLQDQEGVYIADSVEEFAVMLRTALRSPRSHAERREVSIAMASQSWASRCMEMARLVDERMRS